MNKKQLATEGAEIAAGAGLGGTDLGAGTKIFHRPKMIKALPIFI